MAFPPGFLDDLKSRLSLAQVAGKKVTWDNRKSNPGKGDYWAPCPFHQEKTPSFHVDDRKGFFYCFGCHQKGDVVGFTMEIENLSFMEAVERLAAEAGMEMPARNPRAREKADARSQLVDVMEDAVKFYRLQLKTNAAGAARAYLDRRGLEEAHRDRFEVGFAPNSRTALTDHLTGKGTPLDLVIAAGLAIKPDDGGKPFDRFRDRIMFPIRDPRGRAIAFGGRAMSPEARAKYLNSPETPLFDKGRTLFNFGPARQAAGKSPTLIVAEGYMDVIALVTHGFETTVAPNGTAITPDQLNLMWRIADEPIIALDGDEAGNRAARRLIDLALPMLKAGKSLRFCVLPDGLDPDDVLRQQGRGAMAQLLDDATSLFDMLWQREVSATSLDTPERRAAFDGRLRDLLRQIGDPGIRNHYDAEIRARRRALFALPKDTYPSRGKQVRGRAPRAVKPTADTRKSLLAASADGASELRIRESMIVALCLAHPNLARDNEAELEGADFQSRDLARIRDAILSGAAEQDDDPGAESFFERISAIIGPAALENLRASGHVRANPLTRPGSDAAKAQIALLEDLSRHRAIVGHHKEIQDAQTEITGNADDEGLTWRLKVAAEAKENAARSGFAPENADAEEQQKLSKDLQKLIDDEAWIKK